MEPLTLTDLPEIATAADVARVIKTTEDALAQDRYLRRGLPYIKIGRRVRYLRADIVAYLEASRHGVTTSTA
jgi:hypothetical protein